MNSRPALFFLLLWFLIPQIAKSQLVLPSGNADLGAQINAAIAALPANGGKIIVNANPAGQCYSYTTPIVLTKAVIVEGDGPSTCLNFNGTGSAVSISNNSPPYSVQGNADSYGLRDLMLLGSGPGSGQVGIEIGGPANSVGFYGSGLTISSFGIGLKFDPGVWNFKMEHSIFALNQQSVYWASNLHFGGENVEFDSVTFDGASFLNSVEIDDHTTTDFSNLMNLTFVSCNFDNAQLVINEGAGGVRLYSPHFENPGQNSGTNPFVILRTYNGASDVVMDGPDFYNDQSGTYPASFVEIDGAPTVTITQMRSVNLDGTNNVPTNVLIGGDAPVTLIGDAPLRGAKQQYVIVSGNPKLWITGGSDPSNRVQAPGPMLYSQTVDYANSQSPVIQVGGTDWQPTIGLNLWTGSGTTFYGMELKEPAANELDFCSSGPSALGAGSYQCNAGIVNGVFTSRVPNGTAPLSVSSQTPPDNLNAWPATFNADGSQSPNAHMTTGKVNLGSFGQAAISFSGAARFSQTPSCVVGYQTDGPRSTLSSLSSSPTPIGVTIFGQPYIGVYYVCLGN